MTSRTTLICLPHGGAGASAYRPWAGLLPPQVELLPLQLPGREARFMEPLAHSTTEVVGALCEQMLACAGDRFALFGHSLGALLAYELAHEAVRKRRPPTYLFVSGCPAPHLVARAGQTPVHLLPDDELLALVTEQGGSPAGVVASPELMRVLLPVLRADYEMSETYRYVVRPALPIPVVAFGGTGDLSADLTELDAWRQHTSDHFTRHTFAGGHFYLLGRPDLVIDKMVAALSEQHIGGIS